MGIGLAEIWASFFALGYLALIVYFLVLATRLVRAVEKIAGRE